MEPIAGYVAYVGVLALLLGVSVILLSSPLLSRTLYQSRMTWHVWFFVAVVGVSQIRTTVGGDLTAPGLVQAFSYFVSLVCAYFVLAEALRRNFRTNLGLLSVLGVLVSLPAIVAALFGQFSVLGLRVGVSPARIPLIGLPASRSIFQDENYFAVVLFVCGTATFFLQRTTRSANARFLLLLALLPIATAMVFTYSRAAYLATMVASLLWLASARRGLALAAALLVVAMIAMFWLSTTQPYADRIGAFAQVDRGLSGREMLWPIAIDRILERPFFGWGIGSVTRVISKNTIWASSHNSVLDFALMAGIPSGIAYIWFITMSLLPLLRQGGRSSPPTRFLLSTTVGLLVAAQFTTHTIGGLSFGSMVLTVLLGLSNAQRWRPFGQPDSTPRCR